MRTLTTSIRDPMRVLGGKIGLTLCAVLLVLGIVVATRPVASEEPSGLPHAAIVKILDERYGESPAGFGVAGNGVLIELFTTPSGSTWTMVLTLPNGRSFIVAAGEDWTPATPIVGRTS